MKVMHISFFCGSHTGIDTTPHLSLTLNESSDKVKISSLTCIKVVENLSCLI